MRILSAIWIGFFAWQIIAAPAPVAESKKTTSDDHKKAIMQRIKLRKNLQRQQEDAELKELLKAYYKSSNEAEKQENYQKIKEVTEKQFYRRLDQTDRTIQAIERQLNQLKKRYQKRKDNADKIISGRVQQLTADPELKW